MYQIFPDRFYRNGTCDLTEKLTPYNIHENTNEPPSLHPDENGIWSTDFYGGNLRGIQSKLPYLAALGVQILYLNPIFSARSNHRYDTADYRRIDPMLGTNADFEALCKAAHALNMRILLDGVFSHTGSDSIYFDRENRFENGAFHHPESPYKSWYRFTQYPNQYECWWGIQTLPCIEEMDDGFLDFLIRNDDSVIAHWLRLGADGFRLDVADELPDAFLQIFYHRVKELKPDALIIGEVWEDASNKISYGVRRQYFTACELDAVMNYPFRTAILDYFTEVCTAQDFVDRIMCIAEHYPKEVLNASMTILSTHDTVRAITQLGDHFSGSKEEKAMHRMQPQEYNDARILLQAAACLQFTLPGCPCIYYGDEVGLEGWEDPLCRRFFPWGNEDTLLLSYYRLLAQIHRQHSALQSGSICALDSTTDLICFQRSDNTEILSIYVNRGKTAVIPCIGTVIFQHRASQTENSLILEPYGAVIIQNNSNPA